MIATIELFTYKESDSITVTISGVWFSAINSTVLELIELCKLHENIKEGEYSNRTIKCSSIPEPDRAQMRSLLSVLLTTYSYNASSTMGYNFSVLGLLEINSILHSRMEGNYHIHYALIK